jgi:hypothetical protein
MPADRGAKRKLTGLLWGACGSILLIGLGAEDSLTGNGSADAEPTYLLSRDLIEVGTKLDGRTVPSALNSVQLRCEIIESSARSQSPGPCRWSTVTVDEAAGDSGYYTSVAMGRDGLPIVSYFDYSARALKVTHCGAPDCSANVVSIVDTGAGDVGLYTDVAIGTDGLPVVSYYDYSAKTLKVARCGDPGCTVRNSATTVDGSASGAGRYTSIAIGSDGLPVISYLDEDGLALKVVHCGDPGCTTANTVATVDDAAGGVGLATSIAIGRDKLPVISYVDIGALTLKVAHCGNLTCTRGNTITTVDDPRNYIGLSTSVAIGGDGLPVIGYFDATADALKVAHCGNLACSHGNTITIVDGPRNSVGSNTSIAMGADGLPVIAYRDFTAGTLKLARCRNPACSTDNAIEVVDGSGNDVGLWTSIAVGPDGVPVISYHDATARTLKVARPAPGPSRRE